MDTKRQCGLSFGPKQCLTVLIFPSCKCRLLQHTVELSLPWDVRRRRWLLPSAHRNCNYFQSSKGSGNRLGSPCIPWRIPELSFCSPYWLSSVKEVMGFFLCVFTEFSNKKYVSLKGLEPAPSWVWAPERRTREIGSLNWAQFMPQWFIRFPEITEFNERPAPFRKKTQ